MVGQVGNRFEPLNGGGANRGRIGRIGDTVRRPRPPDAAVVEELLLHLERVGFSGAPRFLGIDEDGRQVLEFIEGQVSDDPPWLATDSENRRHLALIAELTRELHDATAGFTPTAAPGRPWPLPLPGTTWSHGDVHYGNIVYRAGRPVALLDWEYCGPTDSLYDPLSLVLCARLPRPDRPDELAERRQNALRTRDAVLDGYGATESEHARASQCLAAIFDHAADYLEAEAEAQGRNSEQAAQTVAQRRWLADWWREQDEHR